MYTPQIEQIILYDINRILHCIKMRTPGSAVAYTKHLLLLLLILAIHEERESNPILFLKPPYEL